MSSGEDDDLDLIGMNVDNEQPIHDETREIGSEDGSDDEDDESQNAGSDDEESNESELEPSDVDEDETGDLDELEESESKQETYTKEASATDEARSLKRRRIGKAVEVAEPLESRPRRVFQKERKYCFASMSIVSCY